MEFQENYPVDKLIPYARNSRTHNDEQIAQIVASIKEFGFTNPILIGADDVIIAGHGRLLAAQRMGLKEVPVVRLPHLTETQRRALVKARMTDIGNKTFPNETYRLSKFMGLVS